MGFTLEKVVPWGRSYDEYVSMFDLTENDLKLRILGCGDGPAAFNSALAKCGGNIISIDPIYVFDANQIRKRISETYKTVMTQMRKNQNDYVWKNILSLEQLGDIRMSAMEHFLIDFDAGKQERRYISGELPTLPFESEQFDIALSSHFLFLYSTHLSAEFHIQALQEMLRVAHEVRVFPLLALDGKLSPHIASINEYLATLGFDVAIRRVPYEFQRGGNEMLVIKHG
jgi:hypothetical protein